MNVILRPDLPPLPPRLKRLALDHRGFPVPWFVAWFINGQPTNYGAGAPDFRVVDTPKFSRAIRCSFCWVCGQPLGRHKAFPIGPMCAVNRITSEPGCHRECAIWSAQACPFLTRPRMRRNEHEMPKHREGAGHMILRNPGVVCIWITDTFKPFRAERGGEGYLIELGDPSEVQWFCEGRQATRQEIVNSIETGLPQLQEVAELQGPDGVAELERGLHRLTSLLPLR